MGNVVRREALYVRLGGTPDCRPQTACLRSAICAQHQRLRAQKPGGTGKAGRLPQNLAHNDYFVREVVAGEGRVYQFHPLMREFLIRRSNSELPLNHDCPMPAHRTASYSFFRRSCVM